MARILLGTNSQDQTPEDALLLAMHSVENQALNMHTGSTKAHVYHKCGRSVQLSSKKKLRGKRCRAIRHAIYTQHLCYAFCRHKGFQPLCHLQKSHIIPVLPNELQPQWQCATLNG